MGGKKPPTKTTSLDSKLFTSPGRLPEHVLQPDMVSFNTLMAIPAEQQPNLAIELLGEMYVGGPWSWVWGLCLIVGWEGFEV